MSIYKKLANLLGGAALALFPILCFGLPAASGAEMDSLATSSNCLANEAGEQVSSPTPGTNSASPSPSQKPTADAGEAEEPESDQPEAPRTEKYGDIIDFSDEDEVPYVGGQKDEKSASPFIRDHAELFTSAKVPAWEKQMMELAKQYGVAPYIVTVDDFQEQSPKQWSANYYNANQLGLNTKSANGVIMIINPRTRDLHFLGHGDGEKAFTIYGISKLYERVKEPLGDDDWDKGVEVYLGEVADYLKQWKAGKPYDEDNHVPHRMSESSTVAGAGGALAIGAGTGYGVMSRMKKKHHTAQQQAGATHYVVPGSNKITGSNDVLVNSYTTQVALPDDSDKSDFSGGSYSSGGTSFSSGGGKF